MKIVAIIGGLGSQMFKYAFFYALKKRNANDVLLDTSYYMQNKSWNGYELGKIFNIADQDIVEKLNSEQLESIKNKSSDYLDVCLDFLNQFGPAAYYYMGKRILITRNRSHRSAKMRGLRTLRKKILMGEHLLGFDHHYQVNDLHRTENAYFDEYAINSDDLFANYKQDLKKIFQFPKFDAHNNKIANEMQHSHSVAIHVRRSDHLTDNNKLIKNGYYKRAVSQIKLNTNEKQIFYVFSEDISWCENNLGKLGLSHEDKIVFVDWNKDENSYRDMQLMTYCQHHVIPISSFSWWGYYLSNRDNKIVCAPKGYWTDVAYHF